MYRNVVHVQKWHVMCSIALDMDVADQGGGIMDICLRTHTKINSRWIKDPNVNF